MTDIATNLRNMRNLITGAEQEYHRIAHSVALLAVSKGQPAMAIKQAYIAGQKLFGENYLQEALTKMTELQNTLPNNEIEWHFIGRIQSNKAKLIAQNFSWVQSLDRIDIAKLLNEHRPKHLSPLNILLEINLDAEQGKAGINIDETKKLAEHVQQLPHLSLRGLMIIPQYYAYITAQRASFQRIYRLFKEMIEEGYELDTLSMGMSQDYQAAIAEGSTMVRIGTAIFGNRP